MVAFELVQESPWDFFFFFFVPEIRWSNCNSCFQPLVCSTSVDQPTLELLRMGISHGREFSLAMGKADLCWAGPMSAQMIPMGSILPPCTGSALSKCGARRAVGSCNSIYAMCTGRGQQQWQLCQFHSKHYIHGGLKRHMHISLNFLRFLSYLNQLPSFS